MAPPRAEFESFVKIGIEWELEGGEEGPFGGKVYIGFRIKQFCEATAQNSRMREKLGCGGKGNVGPIPSKAPAFSMRYAGVCMVAKA